ncbi:helix-turn-helix transcriptional regulator [Variovorax sp. J22R133]|uniref:helix-turn-helix domain-containing protein n=1 Tax=Variovorax brevis TaxID=3053503 RepID=UPI002576D2DA|nr:helix-turn-helix transcriptional regulator [Variovorax sp. J22R133]MDM0117978.1 helix-turn-helix transcriptional regulator [Variovorax sp. J22R133]
MPNIASILKAEIVRVARKEVRSEMVAVKKANAQYRALIAALRREVEALRKELRRAAKPEPRERPATAQRSGDTVIARRFSASRLAAHRSKLGLSAALYGKLVGLSGQTIYNWEQGRSRPNANQIQQLAVVKELSHTALLERLESAASD